jgi:hypothetical protein
MVGFVEVDVTCAAVTWIVVAEAGFEEGLQLAIAESEWPVDIQEGNHWDMGTGHTSGHSYSHLGRPSDWHRGFYWHLMNCR